jgi:TPP-dependent trihydroxycyclohexane-1,2-dione (THcHDO) dehydratase
MKRRRQSSPEDSLADVATLIKRAKNILVVTGAGISVSSGNSLLDLLILEVV